MREIINKYLKGILVFLMILMTVDVIWGVFTRYVFGSQADWTEELARFLLIWIGLLGAAYASGQRMHLAIDLLATKVDQRKQAKLNIIINIIIILFVLSVLVIGGFNLIYLTNILGQLSAALRVPMFVVYAVVPLSGILILYYKIDELSKMISRPVAE